MIKDLSVFAVTSGFAILTLLSDFTAQAATLPALSLLSGREQAMQFGTEIESARLSSENVASVELDGTQLVVRGISPGKTDLILTLTDSQVPLRLSVEVEGVLAEGGVVVSGTTNGEQGQRVLAESGSETIVPAETFSETPATVTSHSDDSSESLRVEQESGEPKRLDEPFDKGENSEKTEKAEFEYGRIGIESSADPSALTTESQASRDDSEQGQPKQMDLVTRAESVGESASSSQNSVQPVGEMRLGDGGKLAGDQAGRLTDQPENRVSQAFESEATDSVPLVKAEVPYANQPESASEYAGQVSVPAFELQDEMADVILVSAGYSQSDSAVHGDASTELTLLDAVKRALELNPEVQAEAAEVERALTEIKMAEAGYWPSLQLSAGPDSGFVGELSYDVVLSQMLFDWGRASSDVAAATARQRQQVQSLLNTRNDQALELIEVCFDLQSIRQQLEGVDAFQVELESLHDLVEQRAQGGYSDTAELSRIRQTLGYMQEQRAALQGSLLEAESQYRLLMNLPADMRPRMDVPVDLLTRLQNGSALDHAIFRSPKFMEAQQDLALAQAQIDNAESLLKPRLMLEASSQRREVGGEMTDDSAIALRFRMESMQGLSAFQRAGAERERLKAAQWRLDGVQRELRRHVNTLQANKVAQIHRQQALEQQIGQIASIRDTYREQFIVGLRMLDDLIGIERESYELFKQRVMTLNERQRLPYRAAADLGLLMPMLSGELERSLMP